MKKYFLLLVCATFIISCKKIQAGGNKDALKLDENIVRYSDENAPKPTYVKKPDTLKPAKPNLTEPGLDMNGYQSVGATPKTGE